MREELAVKNLREAKEIFDKYGIEYWLDWGTLLGAVRDGKIIQWDSEIDLGVMSDYLKRLTSALSEFEERGFDISFTGSSLDLFRFGIKMDIHVYFVVAENAIMISRPAGAADLDYSLIACKLKHSGTRVYIRKILECLPKLLKPLSKVVRFMWIRSGVKTVIAIVPKRYFEKFKTIKFYGMTFNIPFDTEGYLRLHYGKDWKVPRKEWYWVKDDGTVRILKGRIFSKVEEAKF